jgi:AraC-like DNA-binding protein
MSVSGFHHRFKSVTAMSPLQFQKQIRLQEARRLMLGEDLDAASAGFRVGYENRRTLAAITKSISAPRRNVTSPGFAAILNFKNRCMPRLFRDVCVIPCQPGGTSLCRYERAFFRRDPL